MKAIILAGGYGTRFIRDLEPCRAEYSHLVGLPKPLLPVAGLPLLSHWVHLLDKCSEVTGIHVVVSGCHPRKRYLHMEHWCAQNMGKYLSEITFLQH